MFDVNHQLNVWIKKLYKWLTLITSSVNLCNSLSKFGYSLPSAVNENTVSFVSQGLRNLSSTICEYLIIYIQSNKEYVRRLLNSIILKIIDNKLVNCFCILWIFSLRIDLSPHGGFCSVKNTLSVYCIVLERGTWSAYHR